MFINKNSLTVIARQVPLTMNKKLQKVGSKRNGNILINSIT